MAVQIVTAQTYARDALRAASRNGTDPDQLRQARAWASSMMRQADSGIRTLLHMQAERQKAEDAARPAAMQRAGYWFRSASAPEPVPNHEPAEAPRAPLPLREQGGGRGPAEQPKLEYGAMTPAERYVTLYPDRAAAILAAGGLPTRLLFPPPDPDVITDLLTSQSPLIRAFRQTPTREPVAA
ncbi:MAG: hypothetical protein JO303_16540 [Caulobacteraceae bacterium]|nr:hypothetical protein [Caulobacteraceae bacterium]